MGHGDHLLRDTDLWEDGMRFDPLLAWKALEPPWTRFGFYHVRFSPSVSSKWGKYLRCWHTCEFLLRLLVFEIGPYCVTQTGLLEFPPAPSSGVLGITTTPS